MEQAVKLMSFLFKSDGSKSAGCVTDSLGLRSGRLAFSVAVSAKVHCG